MMNVMGLVLLMQEWIVAAYQMSCQADGVEIPCPPRVCPNSQVVFTCTVQAASSSFWKLPANTCPSYNPRDTINLAQTAGSCQGATNRCGPFSARNLASGSGSCLTSSLSVVATVAAPIIACGATDINGHETVTNTSSIIIFDIPGNATTTAIRDTVANIIEHTVTIEWTPPTVGGTSTSYNISINGSYPIAIPANGSNQSLMYTYTGLESDTVYEVSLVAINCAGTSKATKTMIHTRASPPKDLFAYVWGEMLTFHWSPVGGSVLKYHVMIFINETLSANDTVLCASSLCSYSLLANVSNITYFMISVASINGDDAVSLRRSYTISIMQPNPKKCSLNCPSAEAAVHVIPVGTTMAMVCIIEFAVIITLSIISLWLKNKLSRKPILPLQAESCTLPIVRDNEAYATTLAYHQRATKQ